MADNSNRIAGTAYLAIDGKSYALVGEFSWKPSTPTREPLMGMDGFHGYKEKPGYGMISATLRDGNKVSVTDLGDITNATITVELANTKTIIGRNMFTTEQPETDAEEGTIKLAWAGPSVTEA